MDPITTALIAAIGAGALKSVGQVGENLVADGYAALKSLIMRKFSRQSEVVQAVEGVESRPDSEGRRQTLREEIVAAKLDQDAEILLSAKALLDRINAQPGGEKHVQNAVGSYIAQADRQSRAEVHVNSPDQSKS
jgi:hypothetical protein